MTRLPKKKLGKVPAHKLRVAAAQAAAKQQVRYIMSTACSTSIQDVVLANSDGERWFQLYVPSNEHHDITQSILLRANDAGLTAIFVTLDTYVLGWRPSDMDSGYNPFLQPEQAGVAIGFSDPVFRKHFKDNHGIEIKDDKSRAAKEWTETVFPTHIHGWEDMNLLREEWSGPTVLKGILTVRDAKPAVGASIQGHCGPQSRW